LHLSAEVITCLREEDEAVAESMMATLLAQSPDFVLLDREHDPAGQEPFLHWPWMLSAHC
jgi:hypothetical protein